MKKKIDSLLREAEKLLYLNDYDSAEVLLDRVMKLDPQNVECFYFLGEVYCKQERISESVAILEKANILLPHNPRIHHLLGWALFMYGKVKLGKKYLVESLKILPDDCSTLCDLAIVENTLENEKEAMRYVLKALELEPNNQMAQEVFQMVTMFAKMRAIVNKKSN